MSGTSDDRTNNSCEESVAARRVAGGGQGNGAQRSTRSTDGTEERSEPEVHILEEEHMETEPDTSESANQDNLRRSCRTKRTNVMLRFYRSESPVTLQLNRTPVKQSGSVRKPTASSAAAEDAEPGNEEEAQPNRTEPGSSKSSRNRKRIKRDASPSSDTPQPSRKTAKLDVKSNTEVKDPFNIDQVDNDPEPLERVSSLKGLKKQSGDASSSAGTPSLSSPSGSKYVKTEQNAKAVLAFKNDASQIPTQSTPTSRSRTSSKPVSRRIQKIAVQRESQEPESMDVHEDSVESKSSQGSTRARKRQRSSASVAPPASDHDPPTLTPDQQVAADFPADKKSIPLGARVYGLFSGTYYPAVVSRYDGKYKLKFEEDGLIKVLSDVNVIPVRDIRPGMQIQHINREREFTSEIKTVPDRREADEWFKGKFEGYIDAEKKETISFTWSEITFDTDQAKVIDGHEESFRSQRANMSAASSRPRTRRSGVHYGVPVTPNSRVSVESTTSSIRKTARGVGQPSQKATESAQSPQNSASADVQSLEQKADCVQMPQIAPGKGVESSPKAIGEGVESSRKGAEEGVESSQNVTAEGDEAPRNVTEEDDESPRKGAEEGDESPRKGAEEGDESPRKGAEEGDESPRKGAEEGDESPRKGAEEGGESPRNATEEHVHSSQSLQLNGPEGLVKSGEEELEDEVEEEYYDAEEGDDEEEGVEDEDGEEESEEKVGEESDEEGEESEEGEDAGALVGNDGMEEKQGSLTKMFEGMHFVLTTAKRLEDDGDFEYLDKEVVGSAIATLGGKIVQDMMALDRNCEILLISDTSYRTSKYLSALALGVPCIHFDWIAECLKSNDVLDYRKYLLPAGVDMLTGDSVLWHGRTGLFEGKVMAVFGNQVKKYRGRAVAGFSAMWGPIVRAMKAELREVLPNDPAEIFCVVTDGEDCPATLSTAFQLQVPIATAEWLIECLIRGEIVDFGAHSTFRFSGLAEQKKIEQK